MATILEGGRTYEKQSYKRLKNRPGTQVIAGKG